MDVIKLNFKKKLNFLDNEGLLDISFEIIKGKFTTLFGKSGSGKTTILRILAGLTQPEEGTIEVAGKTWLNTFKEINIAPQKRQIGFVFQDFALFPNMSVLENISYASNGRNKDKVLKIIEMLELQNLSKKKPEMLSGGQKQRVALARALARDPELLLLDEPLSALDTAARQKIQNELLLLHHEFNLTTIMVSHDINEIQKLSDQVIVLEAGKILRSGTPSSVFKTSAMNIGMVIDKNRAGEECFLFISIRDKIIKIISSSEEFENYKPGDSIKIISDTLSPNNRDF